MILLHYMKTLTEARQAQPSQPSSLRDRFDALVQLAASGFPRPPFFDV